MRWQRPKSLGHHSPASRACLQQARLEVEQPETQMGTHMEYRIPKQQRRLLCHNSTTCPSPPIVFSEAATIMEKRKEKKGSPKQGRDLPKVLELLTPQHSRCHKGSWKIHLHSDPSMAPAMYWVPLLTNSVPPPWVPLPDGHLCKEKREVQKGA